KQARYPLPAELAVQREIAVLVVAKDRMTGVREVYPDLVRAAGEEAHLEHAEIAAAFSHPHLRTGRHAALSYAHPSLAAVSYIFVQRVRDLERGLGGGAFDDGRIDLLHPTLAELLVHGR